jgi:formylglycine-generating enzyme required for sulfatase activity
MISRSVVVSVAAVLGLTGVARGQSCNADINGDGVVNGQDLAAVLAGWGVCPPRITEVTPLQGSVLGGTVITITGSGMATVTGVTVGGNPCTSVVVLSPASVRATTPAGAVGQAPIVVTSPSGSALSPTPFTYVQQIVSSISPSTGPFVGGTPITISGSFLQGTTAVTIGGVPCTNVIAVNSTTVTAVTPPGSVGPATVVLSGTKGTVTVSGGYSYTGVETPSWATLVEAFPDPVVVTDAALRAAIVTTGSAWRVRDTATQIEFVLIPPGTFQMGCSTSDESTQCPYAEYPVHPVTLTNAFYLARYETTQAHWVATMGSNPSFFTSASAEVPAEQVPSRPVERVSWNTIQGFLNATGMRLPTEAEWEYAYRAGTTTAFHSMPGHPNGTNATYPIDIIAWRQSGQTRPVGQLAGNGFGLHDMSGNVFEWVNDWYGDNYYASSPSVNPPGPSFGSQRVMRGGGWSSVPYYCRSSERSSRPSSSETADVGFRVARNP